MLELTFLSICSDSCACTCDWGASDLKVGIRCSLILCTDALSENFSPKCRVLFVDNLVDNHIQMHKAVSISLHGDIYETVLSICMW